MATFDEVYYDKLVRQQRYGEVANYLKSFDFGDNSELNEQKDYYVSYFERQDKIRTALLNKAKEQNPLDRSITDAINFTNAFNSGGPLDYEENVYGKEFSKQLTKLGSTKDEEATGLRVDMSQEAYKNFLTSSGFIEDDFTNLGINKSNTSKGNIELKFSKNNTNISSILQGLKGATTHTIGYYPLPGGGSSFPYEKDIEFFSIYGVSDDGRILGEDEHRKKFHKLLSITDEAVNKNNKAIEKALQGHYISGITTYGALGKDLMQLERLHNINAYSDAEYNNRKNDLQSFYNTQLSGSVLTNYTVYSTNPKTGSLELFEIDNVGKSKLNDVLQNAIGEKRVDYQAASNDGIDGTLITIYPKKKENAISSIDKIRNKYDDKGYDVNAGYQIFVPGLFQDSVDQTVNSNTKNKTLREIGDMRKWDISYTTRDGDDIEPLPNNQFIYKSKTEGTSIRDQSFVQDAINKDIIKKEAIKAINRKIKAGVPADVINQMVDIAAAGAISESTGFNFLNKDYDKLDTENMSPIERYNYEIAYTEYDEFKRYLLNAVNFYSIYSNK